MNSMRQSAAVKHYHQQSINELSEASKIQAKLREWIELCHHFAFQGTGLCKSDNYLKVGINQWATWI